MQHQCCAFLQRRHFEAVECLEKGLVLRQLVFGPNSPEVWEACKHLGELCNELAMQSLQGEDLGMVLELLRKAEILTAHDEAGHAVTLNNLGVYFRRCNKLHTALNYMRQAVSIEERLDNVHQPGDSHINLCVTLSQCGRHKQALKAGLRALQLLQQELFAKVHPGQTDSHKHRADRIATMAVAHHNVGVEYEFLFKMTQALASYAKGVELASTYLGEQHGVTLMLRNAQLSARKVVEKAKKSKESAELAAQRAAEAEMLKAARAPPSTETQDVGELAAVRKGRSTLERMVDDNTLTWRDTKYGSGVRPKPASVIKLEETLARLTSKGVVRSGSQKTSSAANLSHCDGGMPSRGPVKPQRTTGGLMFDTGRSGGLMGGANTKALEGLLGSQLDSVTLPPLVAASGSGSS